MKQETVNVKIDENLLKKMDLAHKLYIRSKSSLYNQTDKELFLIAAFMLDSFVDKRIIE